MVKRPTPNAQVHLFSYSNAGDGDGRVDAVDIQKFLGTFGAHFSLEEVEEFINEESAHPNGVMALCRSFISMVTPARSSPGAGLP
mmetsp:Transcript_46728/g.146514  ORF Transcript_46728/g.146514 Transcript_46728/m.146514 type:complete len:85 (-) Transcript_46728:537-791(-)